MTPEPDEYLLGRVADGLALDPRTAEQGITVRLVAGSIYLTGTVTSTEHRDLIGVVAAELADGHPVRNEVAVCAFPEPTEQEVLS